MQALHAAPVAQRIESRTSNPKVVGSNPTGRASASTRHRETESGKIACFPMFPATPMQDGSGMRSGHGETPEDTKSLPTATENATAVLPTDPDLRRVVLAWDRLPEAIRRGILAMVGATA